MLGRGRRGLGLHLLAPALPLALSISRNCLALIGPQIFLELWQKWIIFLCCPIDLCSRFTDLRRIRFCGPYAVLGLGTLLGLCLGVVDGLLVACAAIQLASRWFLFLLQILLRITNKLIILYKNLGL